MSTFNTIHIFGYGETQIIGEDLNFKTDSSSLTSLANFVNHVKSLKPEDVVAADYHVIHVFNGSNVRYLASSENKEEKKTFIVNLTEIDSVLLDALAQELIALATA
jgi:hypothetical protein